MRTMLEESVLFQKRDGKQKKSLNLVSTCVDAKNKNKDVQEVIRFNHQPRNVFRLCSST